MARPLSLRELIGDAVLEAEVDMGDSNQYNEYGYDVCGFYFDERLDERVQTYTLYSTGTDSYVSDKYNNGKA